jgi:hypothetical protein
MTESEFPIQVMAKSFTQNEKAPHRGFSTLAHAGDPTPVNWIDQTVYHFPRPANRFSLPYFRLAHLCALCVLCG